MNIRAIINAAISVAKNLGRRAGEVTVRPSVLEAVCSRWWIGVALMLSGCAPSISTPLTTSEAFAPTETERATICASVKITENGLRWTVPGQSVPEDRVPPYTLRCPKFAISETEKALTLQAPTLDAALNLFTDEAYFLVYDADQRVRFPAPGVISADPWTDLDPVLQEQHLGVSVKVTAEGGSPQLLLNRGQITPLNYDPKKPLLIELNGNTALIWRKVQIEAARGLVQAFR